MNKNLIKQIILEQKEEIASIFSKEQIITREIDLLPALSHPNAVVVTGARRTGKSFLALLSASRTPHAYLNFDDERMAPGSNDLQLVMECFYELFPDLEIIILDEVQNVPGWELFVSRIRRTKRVIVTGSNARLLSRELSTHLAGRHIDFTLLPFSFREHLRIRGMEPASRDIFTSAEKAGLHREFARYLDDGGFPEVHKFGRPILKSIYEDVLMRDIILRYKIRKAATFRDLARILASQFAREFTYSRLKDAVHLKDVHTVRKFVDYLESSCLFFVVERFSSKLRRQVLAPKKIYSIDTGLIHATAFRTSEDRGWLYENCVAVELLRRKHYRGGPDVFYWKGAGGGEVDFCLKDETGVRELIQVCVDIGHAATRERELRPLAAACEELGCKALTVLTDDEEGEESFKGKTISIKPIWKWLLAP
jgi:predicted AAA+ superfamily ATPase